MKYTPRVVTRMDEPVIFRLPDPPPSTTLRIVQTMHPPNISPLADRVFPDPKKVSWKIAPKYNKSFKKVLRDREIKMTNYSVGTIEEKWQLARIPRFATNGNYWFNVFCYQKQAYYDYGRTPFGTATTYYDDNYDLIRAVDSFPAVEYTDTPSPEDIANMLNDLKAKVVQESYSGFDALTELGELPETLSMLLSLFKLALRPLQGIKALQEKYQKARSRGKTHKEAHSEIASQWMQYRYGIMPLVYSIQDAIQLLDEAFAEFKTDRGFSVLSSKPKTVPSTETHIAIYRAHEVKISVVGKSKYETYSARLKDLITTNLFVTAWELIPMSFVIDWFINVGDVIATSTSGMMDLSEERKFCYSIRRSTIDRHVLNYKFTDGLNYNWERFYSNPCTGVPKDWLSQYSWSNETTNIGSVELYSRHEESYERFVFQPNTVGLKFEPNLNWMRALDGYVLSFNQINKLIKKLR